MVSIENVLADPHTIRNLGYRCESEIGVAARELSSNIAYRMPTSTVVYRRISPTLFRLLGVPGEQRILGTTAEGQFNLLDPQQIVIVRLDALLSSLPYDTHKVRGILSSDIAEDEIEIEID